MSAELDDATLVARARRGDGGALDALVRRHMRAAVAVALGVLRHPADAEDTAQDAMVSALAALEQCREPARFAAWLLRNVRNKALNRLAQRRPTDVAAEVSVAGDAERVAARQQLLAALGRLSDVQREVVLLHDLEAWTHAEIAAALDISEVNSRQHLFVARRVLRTILDEVDHA